MARPDFRHHHVGVAVADMAAALAWYQDVFGFKLLSGPCEDERQKVTVAFLSEAEGSGCPLELVAPLGDSSPVFRYLKADQTCYHVCYEVESLHETLAWLKSKKCLVVSGPFPAPALDNRPLAWVYLPNRHLVELVQSRG